MSTWRVSICLKWVASLSGFACMLRFLQAGRPRGKNACSLRGLGYSLFRRFSLAGSIELQAATRYCR